MLDNFVERCVTGKAHPDEIDDYIELWHDSDSDSPLHEYLGLTWDEYRAWAANKTILVEIVASRTGQQNYTTVLADRVIA
jgi:hypothetical protein